MKTKDRDGAPPNEIGGEFNLSVERVRQLEERALDKLRRAVST